MKRSGVHIRRARPAAAAATLALGLGAGLSACSTTSPAVIQTPYQAADGTDASIPGSAIKLSNFLVVSPAKGQPGQVIGAVVNQGSDPVVVTMQTDLGASAQFAQTRIKVPAHGIAQVGPSGTEVPLSDTPVEPGALMQISANYQPTGGVSLTVPVVLPSGYYAGYTVAPTTSAPESSSSPEASPAPTSS